jgi:acetoacetate decarboxylase
MPATAPSFAAPPLACTNVETLTVSYETDVEAALDVLPSVLELAEPATATLGIFHIGQGALGSYHEANLFIDARFEGNPCRYAVTMLVTNDGAMLFGREALGIPKKLAHIELERRPEGVFGFAERPVGHRLISVGVALEECVEPAPTEGVPAAALRIIPEPEGKGTDASIELLSTHSRWDLKQQWRGSGSISFPETSCIDEWSMLPVRRITGAAFTVFDIVMPRAKLLARM